MTYKLTIDDRQITSEDPVLTGRQLLEFADRTPAAEHLIFVFGERRQLEDIDLEESIDVREPGHDRFLTFHSDRIFHFTLDDRRQPWGAKEITETTLRELAGVGKDYHVWQERRQEEDLLLEPGQAVSLDASGVERFYTGKDSTTAGRE